MKTLTEKAEAYCPKISDEKGLLVDFCNGMVKQQQDAFLAGYRQAIADAAEVAGNHLKHPIACDIWQEIKKLGEL